MQFSRKTDYGLILLGVLRPTFASGEHRTLTAVAAETRLPLPFLAKLAGRLRKHGVLDARKGVFGGYRLMRDPKTLALSEIITILEEPPMMRCLKSNHPEKHCPFAPVCPTQKTWRDIHGRINRVFESVTVAEL